MTETFRMEANALYKTYRRLYKLGVLKKEYTISEIYLCYKNNKEVVNNV